jgi:serine/threonine-protein kinase
LYEVLTGKLPFDAKSPMEYIQKHVMEPIIPLSSRAPEAGFPAELDVILNKALSKEPGGRYQTAAEFAEALRPFAADDTSDSPHSSLQRPDAAPASPAPPRAAPSATPTLLIAVAGGCLVLGVLIAVIFMTLMGR